MRNFTLVATGLALLLLSACSGVSQRPAAKDARQPSQPTVNKPAALGSKPVRSLMARAETQRRQGQLAAAAGTLERALRIEQHNPHLWHRLAKIRLQQGQGSQAVALAAKSNRLAGADAGLRRANQAIMDSVR
jgi:Flp pilus assembly protein TadD